MDLTKAFDTLDHDLLLKKLTEFGLSKSAVNWFRACLTRRTQSIYINDVLSDPEPILYGVPQGSNLGPLLFIMYINELPTVVNRCKVHLYADDTLLYFESSSVQQIEATLSNDLEYNFYSEMAQPELSCSKPFQNKNYVNGTHQKLSSVQAFSVTVKDTTLERVYKFKYLGVTLDPNLSWNEHIDSVGNKISSLLGMLRKARKFLPKEACLSLFNAMILPLFDYCCGR